MNSMFYNCSKLTTLDLSSFDTSNVTDMNHMFYNCSELTTLKGGKSNTLKIAPGNFSSMPLTAESMISVANCLYDYSSGSAHTLRISSTAKTNIASQYVKMIGTTTKDCIACESTDEGATLLIDYVFTNKNWSIE